MEFEKVYNEYWEKIYRLCMGYVNDEEWAEDITQETFITVWKQLPSFRNESSIGTWIYRITVNNCLRQIDRKNRHSQIPLQSEIPDEKSESRESDIKLLYQFISALPEIERIIIGLELEEVKQSTIAEIMGLSEANVRVKIHRIKNKLLKKFREHEK